MLKDKIVIKPLFEKDLRPYQGELSEWFYEAYRQNFPHQDLAPVLGQQRFEALLNYLSHGKAQALGVLRDKQLLGILWYFITEANRLHINELIINQKSRSQGLGSLLLESVIAIAEEKECKALELNVTCHNKVAVALYGKFGFQPERLLMSKPINDGK
ncbi:GNAT family N-acetyltransferase [Streptococcus sp. E17BB]|uniref:GNAT family N-acetyltransferase n=1 Tax=Streptococcus sp. E17BB TaxID=3278714 RepID=UPI00359D8EB7